MCSSAFIHFTDAIFCNVIYWDELDEYQNTDPQEDRPPLPKGFVALARATAARRAVFNRKLAKFVEDGLIYAFHSQFRAIEGLGCRKAPLLQVWNRANRNKPKDILAVSLRDTGFQMAASLDKQHRQITFWQIHEAIVADPAFARELTRR